MIGAIASALSLPSRSRWAAAIEGRVVIHGSGETVSSLHAPGSRYGEISVTLTTPTDVALDLAARGEIEINRGADEEEAYIT